MAFEEQITSYRSQPFGKRLLIMGFIGALYPVYYFVTESPQVEAKVEAAQAQLDKARTELEESRKKVAELPFKIKELDKVRAELEASRARISGETDIDEMLRKTATAAREASVTIARFQPGTPVEEGSKIKYSRQQIYIEAEGKFISATRFLDSLLNLGPLTFLSDVKYTALFKPSFDAQETDLVESYKARSMVSLSANISVFRKVETAQ